MESVQQETRDTDKKLRMVNNGTQQLEKILTMGRTESSHRGLGYPGWAASVEGPLNDSTVFVKERNPLKVTQGRAEPAKKETLSPRSILLPRNCEKIPKLQGITEGPKIRNQLQRQEIEVVITVEGLGTSDKGASKEKGSVSSFFSDSVVSGSLKKNCTKNPRTSQKKWRTSVCWTTTTLVNLTQKLKRKLFSRLLR